MAGEPLIDVYQLDPGNSPEVWKQLEELAKKFTAALAVQVTQSAELNAQTAALADTHRKTEEALKEHGEALKGVERETRKAAEAQKSMADFLKEDLNGALLSAQAQYDFLKKSIGAVVSFVESGVGKFIESEQATVRLDFAMKNAGIAGTTLAADLHELAESVERTTGQSAEFVKGLEQTALQLGVAPERVGRFTMAALDLAAATGTDARNALMQLTRANAEGKDELKRWGISVDEAAFAAKGFDAVLEEVEKRVGGTSQAVSNTLVGVNELSATWDDFQKGVGESVVQFANATGALNALNEAMKGATYLTSKQRENDLRKEELVNIKERLRQLNEIAETGQLTDAQAQERMLVMAREQQLLVYFAVQNQHAAETQRQLNAEVKKGHEENEKHLKKAKDDGRERLLYAMGLEGQDPTPELERIAKFNKALEEVQQKQGEREVRDAEDVAKRVIDLEKYKLQERLKANEAARAAEEQMWHDFTGQLQNAAVAVGQGFLAIAQEQILTNNAFRDEYTRASNDRMAQDQAEADARKRIGDDKYEQLSEEQRVSEKNVTLAQRQAEITKRTAEEEKAAFAKRTAEILAGVATEAGGRALFEGAAAIASAAAYDANGAALHGTAAALYAGVAAALGGAAYTITQSRGKTSDERAQLESLNQRERERVQRDAREAASASKGNAGPSVVVYQMGISGFTELEQARELERMRREAVKLATGGG